MKIKIYTGVTVEAKKCVLDNAHPKFQIFDFKELVEQGVDFELSTNSDFIIRELNCYIMDGILKVENIEVFEDGIQLQSDIHGFDCKSIDDIIEEQSNRMNSLYYNLRFGHE